MARRRKMDPERKAFINSLLEHYQPKDSTYIVTVIKCEKNIYQHMKNGGESYVRYHSSYCNHWKRL